MAYTTIDDPSVYFQTALWTGNGSSQSVVNDGNSDLQPDWLWIKERSSTSGHIIKDTSRGVNNSLNLHNTDEESANSNQVTSINSDGFSVGTDNGTNQSGVTMVAWQWKANGGTTSSNTDGDITTTVQTNSTAGFSIITYTGNGNNLDTIGHGLGATPDFAVVRGRSSSSNTKRWFVKIPAVCGNSEILEWDTTNGKQDSGNGIETMGSSTITLGIDTGNVNSTNESSKTYVCYAFKSIQGYSKIGSYTGNGNADGPFVYTGFKPAWVMIKSSGSNGDNWVICDNKRDTFNVMENILLPNSANAEFDETSFDFLSNGFKLRQNAATYNDNNDTFIYMAFAEHPFVSSKGVPVTAR
jgi:hypothetical protein